jgi:hypothetical protein
MLSNSIGGSFSGAGASNKALVPGDPVEARRGTEVAVGAEALLVKGERAPSFSVVSDGTGEELWRESGALAKSDEYEAEFGFIVLDWNPRGIQTGGVPTSRDVSGYPPWSTLAELTR